MHRDYIQTLLERGVENGVFPGAAVAVGSRDSVDFYTAGVTTPLDGGSQVTSDTIYDIASLTKVFTAMSAMLLLERGHFRLDDTVASFVPQFETLDKRDITLKQILTHSSGLSAHVPLYKTCRTREEMITTIAETPLQHPPGEAVIYSCLGFIVLGQLLERVIGSSFAGFMDREFFQPLNMSDTLFPGHVPVANSQRVAPTEYCDSRKRLMWGEVHDENAYAQGGISGNAGMFSTVKDLARYAQMILAEGEVGRRIISRSSLSLMARNHTKGLNEGRGLGWQLKAAKSPWFGDLAAETSLGHNGFTGTSLWVSPEQNLFVILLSNRVHPTRENNLHIRFRALLHNTAISLYR